MFDKVPLYKYVLVLKTANFIEHCTRPVAILCADTLTLVLTLTKALALCQLGEITVLSATNFPFKVTFAQYFT